MPCLCLCLMHAHVAYAHMHAHASAVLRCMARRRMRWVQTVLRQLLAEAYVRDMLYLRERDMLYLRERDMIYLRERPHLLCLSAITTP